MFNNCALNHSSKYLHTMLRIPFSRNNWAWMVRGARVFGLAVTVIMEGVRPFVFFKACVGGLSFMRYFVIQKNDSIQFVQCCWNCYESHLRLHCISIESLMLGLKIVGWCCNPSFGR